MKLTKSNSTVKRKAAVAESLTRYMTRHDQLPRGPVQLADDILVFTSALRLSLLVSAEESVLVSIVVFSDAMLRQLVGP